MKFLVLADLHNDFWRDAKRNPFEGIEDDIAELDLLILAGDISNKPKVRWKHAFEDLTRLLPPEKIKVFPGNHDFYQFRFDEEHRLREFAASAGIGYVNQSEVRLGPARFLCATLWTDFDLPPGRLQNESLIPEKMNDFRTIRVAKGGYRPLLPKDVIQSHLAQKRWLGEMLSKPFEGPTFVVTHHAPHPGVLSDFDEDVDAAYASDLEDFILKHQPDEWLFGHCHEAYDITIGKTALRNVSLGYNFEVENPAARIRGLIRTL